MTSAIDHLNDTGWENGRKWKEIRGAFSIFLWPVTSWFALRAQSHICYSILEHYFIRNFYSEVSRECNLMFNTCSEETYANNKLIGAVVDFAFYQSSLSKSLDDHSCSEEKHVYF